MANDINRVTLIGRLTADPVQKQTPNGVSVCSVGLAVNEKFKDNENVHFFNLVFWQKSSEILCQYAEKGQQIAVDGRLQQRRWQDRDGNNRSMIEVVVQAFEFLAKPSGKNGQQSGQDNGNYNAGDYTYPAEPSETFSDDEIPFS